MKEVDLPFTFWDHGFEHRARVCNLAAKNLFQLCSSNLNVALTIEEGDFSHGWHDW